MRLRESEFWCLLKILCKNSTYYIEFVRNYFKNVCKILRDSIHNKLFTKLLVFIAQAKQ